MMKKVSITTPETIYSNFYKMVKLEGYTISTRLAVLMENDFNDWKRKKGKI
jgi:hypothetical protein